MSLMSLESLKTARITPAKVAIFVARDVMRRAAAVAVAWRRRNDLRELARFDDRMLADLGLSRGDVASAASEPMWRDPTLRLSALAIERRAAERDHVRWRRGRIAAARETRVEGARSREACAD
ncbi:DUF1127 domain-containing protein [Methylopila turkensis]|uniref:YjiS-like domain-containing protein n=1 Tax=Methylopila turkensis TaxID=1437816 RepID=A0A9W6N559_9HYPH|nr:DUF1127 domain-containing protein [Methylopila turkensis]GLK78834.1 hypothetical protein GCM10008174_05750 [Methylopila turkensis]